MKIKLSFIIIIFNYSINSQNIDVYKFGNITQEEKDLKIYSKDSTANAVYLLENGETIFEFKYGIIITKTKYYAKIKILNKRGYDNATVHIPYYNSQYEKIYDIKGITHNTEEIDYLDETNIYNKKLSNDVSLITFTLPNIKEGSIIEYEYIKEVPVKMNFIGWEFQDDLPKIKSKFHALIPGNFFYNRKLFGNQKLTINESKIKKKCFKVSSFTKEADCEEITYEMQDIPAFYEESYMNSKKNYLSSIKFEIADVVNIYSGEKINYAKTWDDVDKEFKTDDNLGRLIKKSGFLKKKLADDILETEDELSKAKKVYDFVRNNYTWNEQITKYSFENTKDLYKNKIGNSTDINIALLNTLKTANIKSELMLISTRDNGLPTKLYPVLTDFNYSIVKATINAKDYLLDATNKFVPFGVLPERCLNEYGRVFDFDKKSYWINIEPIKNSKIEVMANLELKEDGNLNGFIHSNFNGYDAISKRELLDMMNENDYIKSIEDDNDKLIINTYKNYNLTELEKPFKEAFEVSIEADLNNKLVFFNPFLILKISENPFKLEQRDYPVDFIYNRSFQSNISLKIPGSYKIVTLPENIEIRLPNNGGIYKFIVVKKDNTLNLFFGLTISKVLFEPEEYSALKEFYSQIIKNQNSLITLEKL